MVRKYRIHLKVCHTRHYGYNKIYVPLFLKKETKVSFLNSLTAMQAQTKESVKSIKYRRNGLAKNAFRLSRDIQATDVRSPGPSVTNQREAYRPTTSVFLSFETLRTKSLLEPSTLLIYVQDTENQMEIQIISHEMSGVAFTTLVILV